MKHFSDILKTLALLKPDVSILENSVDLDQLAFDKISIDPD